MSSPQDKEQQQRILNVLRMACAEAMRRPDFAERLQDMKQKFYVRDFDGIFLDPTNLSVYTAQYVPRRALCYYEIFSRPELQDILATSPNIYCLGAGSGSELVGISAASKCAPGAANAGSTARPITIHSQDYTDWSSILTTLEDTIRYKWGIGAQQIKYQFSMDNLLQMSPDIEHNIASAQLVTAMFIFNELFSDKTNAMNFVKAIVKCVAPGAYFLLVDSAGSFSSIQIGTKSYMSYMFFDSLAKHFTPVISEDSKWFRHAPNLDYPLNVENMRYFIRLYRKT
ncbi:hypothetical protein IWW38_001773 [Coemansia aciculifera]|uniref:Uncharacterized protein n=1 Tax=Coemansia aciculifera TaxID=417176 RepID=A0ACC1M798_9FUNG|nr:hypothetical protein IWW38_001773 [Coemansia aciculifera]